MFGTLRIRPPLSRRILRISRRTSLGGPNRCSRTSVKMTRSKKLSSNGMGSLPRSQVRRWTPPASHRSPRRSVRSSVHTSKLGRSFLIRSVFGVVPMSRTRSCSDETGSARARYRSEPVAVLAHVGRLPELVQLQEGVRVPVCGLWHIMVAQSHALDSPRSTAPAARCLPTVA